MSGRVAIVALVASAGALACEPPTGAEPDETLWVGVIHETRSRPSQHHLVPFARWDGTAWRKAWSEPSARIEVAVDSLGRVDARAVESVYPLDWGARGAPLTGTLVAPKSWLSFPRSADDVAAGPGEGVVARVSGLVMVEVEYCSTTWKLRISGLGGDGAPGGVAFSRRPGEVLAESDVPGLPDVEARLGFGRRPWASDGESVWIGLFRFQDATYGVADDWQSPRGRYHLVQIDDERSRSLVQFRTTCE